MLSAEYAAALDGRAREERMKKISDLILRSEARSVSKDPAKAGIRFLARCAESTDRVRRGRFSAVVSRRRVA
jgi:hypothetical protein